MTNHRIKSQNEEDRKKLEQHIGVDESWLVTLNGGPPVDRGGATITVALAGNDWITLGVARADGDPPLAQFQVNITAPDRAVHSLTELADEGKLVTLTGSAPDGTTESRTIKVKVVMENDMPDLG